MKNIKLLYKKNNKKIKRVVSGITAIALLFGTLPISDMKVSIDEFMTNTIIASAEDETYTFTYSNEETKTISLYVNVNKDEDENIINYFKEYAHRYQTDSTFASNHKNDHILITFSGETSNVDIIGFEGIGTTNSPFAGSIEIPSGNNLILNMDAPLFSVVYDTVNLHGSNADDPARISRFYQNAGIDKTTPILATEIKKNPDNAIDKGSWNVSLVPYTEGEQVYLKEFGGFIGSIGSNASITIKADITKSNSEEDPEIPISSNGTDNIGLCCKTMSDGSTLNFILTGDRNIKSVTAAGGNAGGLVGSIGVDATLNYTQPARTTPFIKSGTTISTSGDYAGGIVGENKGTVNITMPSDTKYVIDQSISAANASGGLYGYYCTSSDTTEIDATLYNIDCDLTATTASGGLFGIMESDHSITVAGEEGNTEDYIKSEYISGTGNYGGLIGKYKSLQTGSIIATEITNVRTHMKASNVIDNYGGAIGLADETNPNYVKVTGFTLENADGSNLYITTSGSEAEVNFGGIVGSGKKTFIDASGITIKAGTSSSRKYRGGAIVGDLGDGVLRLSGTVDLSATECNGGGRVAGDRDGGGQIVGKRDDALVFSEDSLSLTRSSTAVKYDDIGSWGEMLRFDAGTLTTNNNETAEDTTDDYVTKTESLSENTVLTVNETAHTIVIGTPVLSIETVADFAKTALCFQIETGGATGNPFVSFEPATGEGAVNYTYATIKNQTISFSSDIDESGLDLIGTGLTGLTRDNDESSESTAGGTIDVDKCPKCVFEGTFNGNGKILKLAIGDTSSGFNGKIYTHNLNGLFGIAKNAEINSVTLDGIINIDENAKYVYAGAGVARSTGTFDSTGVTVSTVSDVIKNTKGHELIIGRLLGEASSSSGDITVSTGTFSGNVTGHNADTDGDTSPIIGGVIGCISQKGAFNADFDTVTSSGTLKNANSKKYQQIGGLIANIEDASNDTVIRTVNLTAVNPDGLTVEATVPNDGCQGGLLGYQWKRTDVNVNSVTVGGTSQSTVKMTGAGNTSGLVYRATGHWDVKNLTFTDVNINATTAKSFGMIVNNGKDGSTKGIYMDLRNGWVYTVTSATLSSIPSGAVFDELVAYSADSGKIMTNGQGIVSIHVAGSSNGGLTMDGTSSSATASGSYTPRTTRGATPNPNTRYYYNLDTITSDNAEAAIFTSTTTGNKSAQNRLMSWAVHHYAASNLQKYFAYQFSDFGANTMGAANTDYDLQGYSWYPLNIGSMTINGNYTLYNSEFEYSEAANGSDGYYKRTSLYDDSIKPNTESTKWNSYTQHYLMQNALFNNVTGTLTVGNVSLSGDVGIAKSGEGSGALVFGKFEGASDTSLANFTVSTQLVLNGIEVHNFNASNTTTEYAPLLINKVTKNTEFKPSHIWATGSAYTSGSTTTPVATSLIGKIGSEDAEHIIVSFSDIRLDGRSSSTPDLSGVYATKRSIFTKATLLESFAFKPASGSSGDYTFKYSEDWTGTTHTGHVTYGSEISDDTTRKEFYNQEFYYLGETGVAKHAVNPVAETDPSPIPYNFSGFLPYVYKTYTGNYHQLEVNHSAIEFSGCGTYNDPYLITSSSDFYAIQQILAGTPENNQKLSMDIGTTSGDRWCNRKSEHKDYTWNGSNFVPTSGDSVNLATAREYVAGSYFLIKPATGTSITLQNTSGKTIYGLGYVPSTVSTNNVGIFHGVINGGGNTIINQTGSPLIKSSNGSVIYNLNVQVDSAVSVGSTGGTFNINGGCDTYGAVIGRVFGGDNIIDDVFVTFTSNGSITMGSSNYAITPVGGYVGVVINGGVIFRGYEDNRGSANIAGLATDTSADKNYTNVKANDNGSISSTSKKWLYINPIIGRVLNGYAFTEADHFRPFDDGKRKYPDNSEEYLVKRTISNGEGVDPTVTYPVINKDDYDEDTDVMQPVTMRNGTKNYSIADLDKNDAYIGEKEGSFAMDDIADDSTITLSNAQALHILQMITECGLGKSTTGAYDEANSTTLKPYTNYMSTHMGDYHYVGNSALTNAAAPTIATASSDGEKDYVKTVGTEGDKYSGNTGKIPYLIKQYTPKVGSVYPAFGATGTSANYNNLILSGDEDVFYVPDGYRGLGALLFGDIKDKTNEHTMFLYSLNGNNKSVSLNMSLYDYSSTKSNDGNVTSRIDNYTTSWFNQAYFKTGFGFINCLISNYNNNTAHKFKNLTLKGSVKYETINYSTGENIPYTNNNIGNSYQSHPAVAGFIAAPIEVEGTRDVYIENVSLDSMEISGMGYAGGYIGAINVQGTYYFRNCSADDLKIFGGRAAGGLVGYCRNKLAQVDADFNGNTFGIISVVCATKTFNFTSDCNSGAGGLIGDNQSNKTGASDIGVTIKNINISNGSSVPSGGYIGYYNDGLTTDSQSNPTIIPAGGVIGNGARGCNNTFENVNVSNLNICGAQAGGFIGKLAGTSLLNVKNSSVITTTTPKCKLESTHDDAAAGTGGVIGYINSSSKNITIDNFVLKGYTVSGVKNVGGLVGYNKTNADTTTLTAKNIKIDGHRLKANSEAGGLIGNLNVGAVNGYNILINNQSSEKYSGSDSISNYGFIIGTNNSKVVKLAGFSRQGTIDKDRMVGNKAETASPYGTNGYVIFADFDGNAAKTTGYNVVPSTVNVGASSDVTMRTGTITITETVVTTNGIETSRTVTTSGPTYSGSPTYPEPTEPEITTNRTEGEGNVVTTVTTTVIKFNENMPYVTVNPVADIDKNETPDFLTSDGINDTAIYNIISNSSNKNYTMAKTAINDTSYTGTSNNVIMNALSTSNRELGNTSNIPNFPILVIDSTKATETTKLVNSYLRLLTNTNYSFNNNEDSALGTVYNIDLIKMRYNKDTKKFGIESINHNKETDANSCLKWTGTGSTAVFKMDPNDVDSSYTQFTLIDLQFLDPTATTSRKVVYHVYAPVLVRRVLRFNFTAKTDSGTNYFPAHYTNAMKNSYIFENLGTPVTIEFEYDYLRTAPEWEEAINSGQSTLMNYYKQLYIKSHYKVNVSGTETYNAWPPGAKLVLVDANNSDKYYYMDDPSSKVTFDSTTGEGMLNLYDFVVDGASADSTDPNDHYKPVDLCELMSISVTQNNAGTLTDLDPDGESAVAYADAVAKTVSGSTTKYYRLMTEDELTNTTKFPNAHRFKASVSGSVSPERYYLSIFTNQTTSDEVYRYEIKSVDDFTQTASGWSIPNSKWIPNKINTNSYCHYFTGYIYDNTFSSPELEVRTPDGSQVMGQDNNLSINVKMTATVELTPIAKSKGIAQHMSDARNQNAHIYQSFLISLNMLEESGASPKIGIQTKPTVSDALSTHYFYSNGSTYDADSKFSVSNPNVNDSSNSFIELQNGQDLLPILANNGTTKSILEGGTGNAVSLHAEYDLIYGVDQIPSQFPKGIFDTDNPDTVTNGTKVIAYSNVASSLEGTAYSSNSVKKEDNKFYYSENSSASTLKYNTDEDPYSDYDDETQTSAYSKKVGPYSMIGINPLDDDNEELYVSTFAIYDASLLNKNPMPGYIELRLSLSCKQTGYGLNHKISIEDYISNLNIYGKGSDGLEVLLNEEDYLESLGDDDDNTTLIVRVPTSSLQKPIADAESYRIPITFNVKTGAGFETDVLCYSNYMLTLEAEMYENTTDTTPVPYSETRDHIIYTNAKIKPKFLEVS